MSSLLSKAQYGNSSLPSREEDVVTDGLLTVSQENASRSKYKEWLPVWDSHDQMAFTNPEPFYHHDKAALGDPSFASLFEETGATKTPITPKLGLVVEGLQLSQLTNQQKNDLALLVAQAGVVAFRNQDFKNQTFDELASWGRYFGPLHVHPTSGSPKGQPNFHLTYRRGNKEEQQRLLSRTTNNIGFHSDVSYETQPPGLTLLTMLQTGLGGDTQYVDMIEAYERLSPTMRKFLDGLKVVHSSKMQAANSKLQGGIQRKKTIDSIHPLVRYHPILKKKALYLSNVFSTRILGFKDEESDALLNFLINHCQTLLDAHIRPSWDENTVVAWDNRRLIHTATLDWDSDDIRHSFRITPLAERPIGSEEEYEEWTPEKEKKQIQETEDQLALTPEEYYNKFYK